MTEAIVTILPEPEEAAADEPLAGPEIFCASVIRVEEPLLELQSAGLCRPGAALKIETGDAVWLGEVASCRSEGGGYSVVVQVSHVLRDFETLTRLSERFGTAAPTASLKRAAN